MIQEKAADIVVYKTDVSDSVLAVRILDELRKNLPGCDASFDLSDCDNVLRVEHSTETLLAGKVEKTVMACGVHLEVLP